MAKRTNNIRAIVARIVQQADKAAGKGLQACAIFLTARVREAVSVPAPRKRTKDIHGNISYRATTRAVLGAPPRKLSGKLRQGVQWQKMSPARYMVGTNARSAKGFNYPRRHETSKTHPHKFLWPTAVKYRAELNKIMGGSLRVRRS